MILGNRVKNSEDEELIRQSLADFEILGFLPEDPEIVRADREGRRPFEDLSAAPGELSAIVDTLIALKKE
jgi:CO dehydrogenase maturation factor